ncbi:hypothetical protein BC937DRAFT_92341 [Endogone sp. FLAS-F59071]|nr:hypothetical protein BC937DRAFT_92341 [Endogone sp. FLAS-F59071]|eukprot:RUS15532.1 hypothetical protein BC937DRAFT_92341 [Endogone sp. FLAS-F59071]
MVERDRGEKTNEEKDSPRIWGHVMCGSVFLSFAMVTQIYAFGFNGFCQTLPGEDDKNVVAVFVPQKIRGIQRIVYAFADTTLGLNDKGELVLWGFNPQTSCIASIPTAFTKFGDSAPVQVYGNGSSIIGALDKEGQIWQYSLSENKANPVILLNRCVDIAYCGIDNTIVAIRVTAYFPPKDDGTLWILSVHLPSTPTLLPLPTPTPRFTCLASFHSSSTSAHLLALTATGDIYSWGSNRFGQLGHGHAGDTVVPEPIEALQGVPAEAAACGAFHSAVVAQGSLYTFGWNALGRLGIGEGEGSETTPQMADFRNNKTGEVGEEVEVNVVKVACGAAHTIAIDDQGSLWICGSGKYGQLGLSPSAKSPIQGDPTEDEGEDGFHISTFRRHPFFGREHGREVVDCVAGFWNTFVTVKKEDEL